MITPVISDEQKARYKQIQNMTQEERLSWRYFLQNRYKSGHARMSKAGQPAWFRLRYATMRDWLRDGAPAR